MPEIANHAYCSGIPPVTPIKLLLPDSPIANHAMAPKTRPNALEPLPHLGVFQSLARSHNKPTNPATEKK